MGRFALLLDYGSFFIKDDRLFVFASSIIAYYCFGGAGIQNQSIPDRDLTLGTNMNRQQNFAYSSIILGAL